MEGYVSLKDQRSLDELRMQRRKLIADLNACTGIDCTTTIQQIAEDIVVIETGLGGWKAQRPDNRDPLLVFRLPPPIFFLRIHRS
ncbi:hypothetical protein [Bradyrhizobium sp. LB13.1]